MGWKSGQESLHRHHFLFPSTYTFHYGKLLLLFENIVLFIHIPHSPDINRLQSLTQGGIMLFFVRRDERGRDTGTILEQSG